MGWQTIIVAILSGVSTGFLTALVTPWAQWAVDVRKDRRKNRGELIKHWQTFLETRSDILHLADDIRFQDLVKCLSQSARQELSQLIDEYEKQWDYFREVDLLRVRREAEAVVDAERKAIEEGAFLPSGTLNIRKNTSYSNAQHLRTQYVNDYTSDTKEKLAKPLRVFLARELAILQKQWGLL